MDEHTNNPSNQPEVVAPDSDNGKETPDNSSAAEMPSTESTEGAVSSAPEVPSSNAEESPGPEEGSDSSEQAPDADADKPAEAADSSDQSAETDTAAPAEGDAAPDTEAEATPPPDETPAPATPSVAGVSGPGLPVDDITPKTPVPEHKPEGKKVPMILAVVVIVILLAGVAIAFAMKAGTKKTPPVVTVTKTTSSTTTKQVPTNVWTGKANTADWDTAANWSLGTPVNGQSLVINATTIKQPSSGSYTFQNNVPSLSINKLTIEGTGTGFSVAGNALTITGGISEDLIAPKGNSTQPQVVVANSVTFTGDQSVQLATNNNLTFGTSAGVTTTTIGTSTVQFVAAKSSDVEVYTPLVGSGEIEVPASTTTTGNVDFNTGSPDFTGSVVVNKGATIGMGNQNTTGNGLSTSDAFGTGTIAIASGAFLELNETSSNSYTVPNNITVDGFGEVSNSKDNGPYTGAISTCITKAQQGCDVGATVTLTGKVTLTGDTQFGAFYGATAAQVPPSTTATYILKNLVTGGHTLTAVTDSKAVIQQ